MKRLFRSQTAHDLLELFFRGEKAAFYPAEIAQILRKDTANVVRELGHLQEEGIVTTRTTHRKKYYALDARYPALPQLRLLFERLASTNIKQRFGGQWLLAEDVPNLCPFFCKIWLNCFVDKFEKPGGRAYKKVAAKFRDYHIWYYFDECDAREVGDHLVDRFVVDPRFMDTVNKEIVRHSDLLRTFAAHLPETRLEKISSRTLLSLYKKHEAIHTAYYQWGWIPVAADMFSNSLTDRGKMILERIGVSPEHVNTVLSDLTQPFEPSLIKQEQDNLRRIGVVVQKEKRQAAIFRELFVQFKEEDAKVFGLYTHSPEYERKFEERVRSRMSEISPRIMRLLEKHYATYFYTKFLFTEEQGVYSFEYYLKELVRLVNNDPSIEATLRDEALAIRRAKEARAALIKKLKLTAKRKRFFDAWGTFMVTKIYRRFAQIFAIYRMTPIVEEIGRRLGLKLKETRFLMTEEIAAGLSGESIDRDEVRQRIEYSVYYADKHEHCFFTGDAARRAAAFIERDEQLDVKELHGQCGCPGFAVGTVKIVNVIEDMKKMEKGDILVSIATQPDLLPAMKRAAAFVTDQGGVTSHAAIVAREINTPCVIGTKNATKVLKDGMRVSVDALKGIVSIIT